MLQEWLAWHHMIFLLPLTVAVLMVLLAGLTDWHLGHSTADTAHAGLDTDAGIDADAHLHADAVGEVPADHGHGGFWGFAALFGVGHVPLTLLLQTMAFLWGFVGLLLVQIAHPVVAIVGASVATLVGARGFAVLMVRLLGGSEAAMRSQFVGKVGEVVLEVTPRFGVVHVRDDRGTLFRLNARAQTESLATGQKIVVVGYDPQEHLYEVADPVRFLESGGK